MKNEQHLYNIGADYAMTIIGGKWKPVILYLMAGHPRRPSELVHQLGTSYKVLSDQLKELMEAGIVTRKSYPTIPPHVEYSLTDEGENLYAALRYLNYWGEKRAKNNPHVKIMCTEAMKRAGDDGLCVITTKHLDQWKQEIVNNPHRKSVKVINDDH